MSLPPGCEQMAGIDPTEQIAPLAGIHSNGTGWNGPTPILEDEEGAYYFNDYPDFTPTLSPRTILQLGSFGGGYFRDITSKVNKVNYTNVWHELPSEWLKGINIETHVASPIYNKKINRYQQNCGAKNGKADAFGLDYWEMKSWINPQDPYGWFHWYTRFFRGRRSEDDRRQIDRWKKVCGLRGRWKMNLIGKVLTQGKEYDDVSVSPVVRQTLQHWAYALTRDDFKKGSERVREKGAAYISKDTLKAAGVLVDKKKRKRGSGSSGKSKRRGVVDKLLE